MAKEKQSKKQEATPEENENPTTQSQILSFLKKNKEDHFNFERNDFYQVRSSSLLLNVATKLGPGCHRFTGITAGGKTSCALDYMFNFLKESNNDEHRMGIYFKCEGKLSKEIQDRSGVKFVTDPNEFTNGQCLIVESNVYEFVFDMMRELIFNNPNKIKYFWIIDSVDMMLRREDINRPLEQANVVAGGALITSTFLKKVSLALSKKNHIAIFINQVREDIKINQYQVSNPKQGKASGGHALEHAVSVVYEFLPRYTGDMFYSDPNNKNSKIIGHNCKIKVIKADKEIANTIVEYPIIYNRKGGKSVWVEMETVQTLLALELIQKGGAGWITTESSFREEIIKIDSNFPEKIQGMEKFCQYLEKNPCITEYLVEKLEQLIR